MKLTRRDFLIKGTALFATLGLGGALFTETGRSLFTGSSRSEVDDPVLVVVQLNGGNDGINTLIPYGQGTYYDARPTLAYQQKDVLALDHQVGLHPSLKGLAALYKLGHMAIIQGVGYPEPNHSHFRSMEIWQTAEPAKLSRSGWLARYAEASLKSNNNPLKAIQIGASGSKAFASDTSSFPVVQSLESYYVFDPKAANLDKNRISKAFLDMYGGSNSLEQLRVVSARGSEAYKSVEAIQSLSAAYTNKVTYPNTNFAKDLQVVTKLLAGKSGTRLFNVQVGGFDDHADEKLMHERTLTQVDEGLTAFYQDLEAQGLQDRVAVVVFSEFGRRVKENGSGGTDHGTAAPMFVIGGKVKGGLYGAYPSLSHLDNGDLKYEVDFRSVYHTVIDSWLKGDATTVLGKSYENLKFI
ncbi:transcriptional initiation protein Tat [Paenibacillus pectinilyticus]|uniref:Transcriptional initiation protein Tat n=1 Tax=Paenibacillus pectinilyticus TaxID=512399 RepID=A0A1C0ZRH3_9BACL|nr:DUF1501 domain-containing protein [Paenibacillus pectinilyticus]OCT10669.1 transcriptional initiation protein Tat [Paenibacillus pectinilyticus]